MLGPARVSLRCASDSVCWCYPEQHSRVARVPMTNIQRTLRSKKMRHRDLPGSADGRLSGSSVHIFRCRSGLSLYRISSEDRFICGRHSSPLDLTWPGRFQLELTKLLENLTIGVAGLLATADATQRGTGSL